MYEPDSLTTLTDNELARLLAPVPLAAQLRDAPVRITLRPDLPAIYAGPVVLADLRLSLSPWHWLKHELASSPKSIALNQQIVEIRATGASLETVAEVADWISNELYREEKGCNWDEFPNDIRYWGHFGAVSDMDGHFLSPSFDLQIVMFSDFYGESEERIVVAQAEWGEDENLVVGPVSVFARAAEASYYDWLYCSDCVWLIDSNTDESPGLEIFRARWDDREPESDNPGDWSGATPDQSSSSRIENNLTVLMAAGLRYEAGQLYRVDSNARLTMSLSRPQATTT